MLWGPFEGLCVLIIRNTYCWWSQEEGMGGEELVGEEGLTQWYFSFRGQNDSCSAWESVITNETTESGHLSLMEESGGNGSGLCVPSWAQ